MHLLSVENITKSYGEKLLFENVTFGVEDGDKIGIIGVNGTGKSTFLKVIAGLEQADSGKVSVGGRVTVRMLAQDPVFAPDETALEHVLGGDSPQLRAVQNYAAAMEALELNPNDEGLQQKLIETTQQMDTLDAWELENEAKTALSKLGINDYEAKVETLSGGQRKRVAMAAALLLPSDVLILDEPTNHIDNDSVAWLEGMLQKRRGALLMITHDRYFLDRVSNRVIELDKGQAYFYQANYSRFLELKLEREEREAASESKRQNLLRNELAWIRRGAKARTTKQKARIDRFEALQADAPKQASGKLDVSVASTRLGRKIIEIEDVAKRFGDRTLIRDFSYIAVPEDRVGIVGRNGSGKSTLLKLIAGRLEPDEGTVELGPTVKLGWFSQEHEEMDETLRVIEYIREGAEQIRTADGTTISAGQMLERFLFSPTMQWTPIAKLSGGEKRRLQLLRVLMNAPNVLLLDEPTNDLDIATLTVLEDYLDDFPGVVFVVSHDRYFLDRTVDKIIAFEGNGIITHHTGNYSEYQEFVEKRGTADSAGSLPASAAQKQSGSGEGGRADAGAGIGEGGRASAGAGAGMDEGGRASAGAGAGIGEGGRASASAGMGAGSVGAGSQSADHGQSAGVTQPAGKGRALKMSYKDQRDFEQIDDWIAEAEQQLTHIAQQMEEASSDSVRLQELAEEQQQQEEKLEQLMDRWTELNELAEQIAAQKQS